LFKQNNNPERVESPTNLEQYQAMSQSLAKIIVHTVFSTKDRRPFLRDKSLCEELHRYNPFRVDECWDADPR
jgi:hypothetical protein